MELRIFVFLLLDRSILDSTWSVGSCGMLGGRIQSLKLVLPLKMQNLLIEFQSRLIILIKHLTLILRVKNLYLLLMRKNDIVALDGLVLSYVFHNRLMVLLELIDGLISCANSL